MTGFHVSQTEKTHDVIKVIGVGGGGKNSLNRLMKASFDNLDFIAANTDAESLRDSAG